MEVELDIDNDAPQYIYMFYLLEHGYIYIIYSNYSINFAHNCYNSIMHPEGPKLPSKSLNDYVTEGCAASKFEVITGSPFMYIQLPSVIEGLHRNILNTGFSLHKRLHSRLTTATSERVPSRSLGIIIHIQEFPSNVPGLSLSCRFHIGIL